MNDNILQINAQKSAGRNILLAISVYTAWVTATYLLEGRILTLLRPEAVFVRFIYTVVANFLIGIIIAAWVLRSSLASGSVTLDRLGFRPIRRTLAAIVTAGVVGFVLFIFQNPPSLNTIAIMNVYAQVLTVSVAEVVVCWAVIGAGFESFARKKGKMISLLAGILAASFSFGIYHFAHSPPFNQVNMVLFLTVVGFFTSLIYFFGRDLYAAVVFHNSLALFGVMQALERSGNLSAYSQPMYPVLAMAVASVIILVCSDIGMIRRIEYGVKSKNL